MGKVYAAMATCEGAGCKKVMSNPGAAFLWHMWTLKLNQFPELIFLIGVPSPSNEQYRYANEITLL